MYKKSTQRVGGLIRLRNLIPTGTKLQLVKAAILPYLTYSHLVWHFCRASDSWKLERVQERALIAISCDRSSSCDKLLNMGNLCTLRNRRFCYGRSYVRLFLCTRLIITFVRNTSPTFSKGQTSNIIEQRNKEFAIPRVIVLHMGSILLDILALSYGLLPKNQCKGPSYIICV